MPSSGPVMFVSSRAQTLSIDPLSHVYFCTAAVDITFFTCAQILLTSLIHTIAFQLLLQPPIMLSHFRRPDLFLVFMAIGTTNQSLSTADAFDVFSVCALSYAIHALFTR